jgi:hydrogenase maturation factor
MCTSRYFRVTDAFGDGEVTAEDAEGRRHHLSLIAYEGPPPQAGTWVVAHSGYALAAAEAAEAELAIEQLHGAVGPIGGPAATGAAKEAS